MQILSSFLDKLTSLTRDAQAASPATKGLAVLAGMLLTYLAVGRLLVPGYQFVGNDADLPLFWIHSTKFFRLWLHSGVKPTWNPFVAGGYPLMRPEEFYLAGVNLWQWLLPVSEKSLDITLFLHTVLMMTGSVLLFLNLRFSVLATLAASAALCFTGTPMAQLFAGHVNLYCALCWAPFTLLSFRACLQRSSLFWTLLHALVLSVVFSYGSLQGFYIVTLLNLIWHVAQVLSGSSFPVPPLQLREVPPAARETNDPFRAASVNFGQRLRELLHLVTRLVLAYLVCFQLTTCYWWPQVAQDGGYGVVDNLYENQAAPFCWLSLLIPHFFLGPGQEYSWTYFYSWEGAPGLGGSFLLLAALGVMSTSWRKLPIPAVVVFLWGMLAGLAWNGPAWKLLTAIDPFLSTFEAPSRLYFLCNFGEAVLLAWAIQQLCARELILPEQVRTRLLIAAMAGCVIWIVSFYANADNPLWKLFFRSLEPRTSGKGYYVLLWTRYSAQLFLWLGYCFLFLRTPKSFRVLALTALLSIDLLHYPLAYLNFRPNEQLNVPEFAARLFQEKKIDGLIANLYDSKWNGQLMILPQHESGNFKAAGQWERQLISRLAESKDLAPDLSGGFWAHPNPLYRLLGVELYLRNRSDLETYKTHPLYSSFTLYDIRTKNFVALRDTQQRAPVYLTRSAMPIAGPRRFVAEMADSEKYLAHMNFVKPRDYSELARTFTERGWNKHYELDPRVREGATIVSETPNELHISCQLQAPAILVVNAPYNEDWKAYVDGAEERVWPAQWGLNRSVLLDQGQHQIVFSHADRRVGLVRHCKLQVLLLLLALTSYFGYRNVKELIGEEA